MTWWPKRYPGLHVPWWCRWFPMFGAEYNIMTDTWTLGLTWPVQKRLWRGVRRPWGWNR